MQPKTKFEAIGQCESISSELCQLLKERDLAFIRLKAAYKLNAYSNIEGRGLYAGLHVLQKQLDEMKETESRVEGLVMKYNSFARSAGKKELSY